MYVTRFMTAAAAAALLAGAAQAQDATTDAGASATSGAMASATTSSAMGEARLTPSGDIVQTVTSSDGFETFAKAVEATNLTSVLKTNQNLTVFAPTDAAFAALPAGELDRLMKPENRGELQKLLTYHVVNAKVDTAKIRGARGEVPTVAGESVTLDGSGDALMVGGATITQADVMASNGVIHVVDKVLMPGGMSASTGMAGDTATQATVPNSTNPTDDMPSSGATNRMPAEPGEPAPASEEDAAETMSMSATGETAAMADAQASVPATADTGMTTDAAASVTTNAMQPIPDTAENRDQFGGPNSRAGQRTAPAGN